MTFEDILKEFMELASEISQEDALELRGGLDKFSISEFLKRIDRKSDNAVNTFYNQSIIMLNSHLELRSVKEQIEYLNNRRKVMLDDFENENVKGINHTLDMKISEIPVLGSVALNFLPNIQEQLPDEINALTEQKFVFELPELGTETENPQEKVEGLIVFLDSLAESRPELAKIVTAKRPVRTAIASALYMHYDKKYLKHLTELVNTLENPTIEIKSNTLEKIEWQGTQKELAELFVELENHGWIREKRVDLIKAYFTKSDTIQQVLKPSQDSKTKEKSYDGIYTPAYTRFFDKIKTIKTHVK